MCGRGGPLSTADAAAEKHRRGLGRRCRWRRGLHIGCSTISICTCLVSMRLVSHRRRYGSSYFPGGHTGIQHLSAGCLPGCLTAHSTGEMILINPYPANVQNRVSS
jgi:hypothetical protein